VGAVPGSGTMGEGETKRGEIRSLYVATRGTYVTERGDQPGPQRVGGGLEEKRPTTKGG